MNCLFCGNSRLVNTFLEDTIFNNKRFSYLQCKNCGLIQVYPLPDYADFLLMYPTDYQGEVTTNASGYYDNLIEKIKKLSSGNRLLDYGCGGGRFLKEVSESGFDLYGVEFNPDLVELLKIKFPDIKFCSTDQFQTGSEKYDIIFMSNVLEHLTNPFEILEQLKNRLYPGGIFVIEGPLENQFHFALVIRKIYFAFKKHILRRVAYHSPRHITFSNAKNQQLLFKRVNIHTIEFKVWEEAWPFPYSLKDAKGFFKKIQFFIAKFSILLGSFNKNWGNRFLYIGRI